MSFTQKWALVILVVSSLLASTVYDYFFFSGQRCVIMVFLMDMLVTEHRSLLPSTCTRILCSSYQKVDGKYLINDSIVIVS